MRIIVIRSTLLFLPIITSLRLGHSSMGKIPHSHVAQQKLPLQNDMPEFRLIEQNIISPFVHTADPSLHYRTNL